MGSPPPKNGCWKVRADVRRRALIASLAAVGLICCGCSGDDPIASNEPRISDTATLVAVHRFDDGIVKEYELDGVAFFGDIRVSEYEFALSVIARRYSEGEVLLSVLNSRVWPQSATNAASAPANGFSLRTCTSDSVASCNEGRIYVFIPTTDGFGLEHVLWWHSD